MSKMEIAKNQQVFLDAEKILRYMVGDNEISTIIDCKSQETQLLTNDFEIYCALGSLMPNDNVDIRRLAKLFEVSDVIPFRQSGSQKPVLTFERVDELRKKALKII